MTEALIPKHGGYRNLKSFQVAQLVYDVTVRFCDRYIEKRSRTHDQMVQAARSGVQNIAEGSQASGTSKKFELKLTSVARASLEELRLDYEDFLRQKSLPLWERHDPRRQSLVDWRCTTADEFAQWVREVHSSGHGGLTGRSGHFEKNTEKSCLSTTSTHVHYVHFVHPRLFRNCRQRSARSFGGCLRTARPSACSAGTGF